MKRKYREEDICRKLLDSTIKVIAEEGLDKATTRSICSLTGTNEAYIYRYYKDKEDLFAKTFADLDEELLAVAMQNFPLLTDTSSDRMTRARMFYCSIWRFLLGNREKCLAYIRYYYSPYFLHYSAEEQLRRYTHFINCLKPVFLEEADVRMILNYILNTMLNFAKKVFDGEVPDDEDTEEHVFRLIFLASQQYFKP